MILIKKLSLYVFLVLMWSNVGFAECVEGDCTNGQGTFTANDGTVMRGIWENNKLVEAN